MTSASAVRARFALAVATAADLRPGAPIRRQMPPEAPRTLPRPRTREIVYRSVQFGVDTELNDAGVGIPSGPGITCDRVAPVPRRGIRAVDIQPVRPIRRLPRELGCAMSRSSEHLPFPARA